MAWLRCTALATGQAHGIPSATKDIGRGYENVAQQSHSKLGDVTCVTVDGRLRFAVWSCERACHFSLR